MKLTFIGGGNMATALIGGLLTKGWPPSDISVVEIDANARERLARDIGVDVGVLTPQRAQADCVVIAVKPQHVRAVSSELAPLIRGKLVVSIAAGIRLADLSRWLGAHQRLVRAMPNTPALVLAGVTALYAAAGVTATDRDHVEGILSAAGRTLWVDSEHMLDAVTALSGSGPAYVFYFMECMQRVAAELGFDERTARLLVIQTFKGAAKLADQSAESAETLRKRVTSKGGTTERALAVLENARADEAIVRAVLAAAQRSRELGDELGRDKDND
jgi:pyrroline-5-carboxylate reductase